MLWHLLMVNLLSILTIAIIYLTNISCGTKAASKGLLLKLLVDQSVRIVLRELLLLDLVKVRRVFMLRLLLLLGCHSSHNLLFLMGINI